MVSHMSSALSEHATPQAALEWAVRQVQPCLLQEALQAGANPWQVNQQGKSPIQQMVGESSKPSAWVRMATDLNGENSSFSEELRGAWETMLARPIPDVPSAQSSALDALMSIETSHAASAFERAILTKQASVQGIQLEAPARQHLQQREASTGWVKDQFHHVGHRLDDLSKQYAQQEALRQALQVTENLEISPDGQVAQRAEPNPPETPRLAQSIAARATERQQQAAMENALSPLAETSDALQTVAPRKPGL